MRFLVTISLVFSSLTAFAYEDGRYSLIVCRSYGGPLVGYFNRVKVMSSDSVELVPTQKGGFLAKGIDADVKKIMVADIRCSDRYYNLKMVSGETRAEHDSIPSRIAYETRLENGYDIEGNPILVQMLVPVSGERHQPRPNIPSADFILSKPRAWNAYLILQGDIETVHSCDSGSSVYQNLSFSDLRKKFSEVMVGTREDRDLKIMVAETEPMVTDEQCIYDKVSKR